MQSYVRYIMIGCYEVVGNQVMLFYFLFLLKLGSIERGLELVLYLVVEGIPFPS